MSKLLAERLVAISLIIVAAILLTQSVGFPQRAGAFHQFAEIGVIVLSLGIFARSYLVKNQPRLQGNVNFEFSYQAWKPVIVMILSVLYAFAVFKIGFYVSSFIFFFIATYMTGLRDHKAIILTAVVLFPLLYFFFTFALGAFLPEGILI